ncbi:MAG: hypothetical protein IK131_11940 [Paludibacteraceae bacterium]|nr:hypothetical protein [Paludibacteraceae bacterium]
MVDLWNKGQETLFRRISWGKNDPPPPRPNEFSAPANVKKSKKLLQIQKKLYKLVMRVTKKRNPQIGTLLLTKNLCIMTLSAPKQFIWVLAVILGVLGILG